MQIAVLYYVWIGIVALKGPVAAALESSTPTAGQTSAVRALNNFLDAIGAAINLTGHAQSMYAVWIFVVDRKVVVAVAVLWLCSALPATHSHALDRVVAKCPVRGVKIVYMGPDRDEDKEHNRDEELRREARWSFLR